MRRYYLGPYVASTRAHMPGFEPPSGVSGALDLAPLAPQSVLASHRAVGLFVTTGTLPSEYDLLGYGDCRELVVDTAMLNKFESLVGYRPAGERLADAILDCLIGGADPQGEAGPMPLLPDSRGWLELHLHGHSYVKGQKFSWSHHPHRDKVKTVLRKQFEKHLEAAKSGKLKDREHHRRVLDAWCDKYGLQGADDWKEFVPQKLQREVPGRLKHETTISENFNTSDSTTLGPQLSWTEQGGDLWEVVSNTASRKVSSSASRVAEAASDLSSDDYYSQVDVTSLTGTGTDPSQFGAATRVSSTTCYTSFLYASTDSNDDNLFTYKISSGVFTLLAGGTAQTVSLPDTVKSQADGGTIKGFFNGSEVHSVSDSSHSGQLRCGMYGLVLNASYVARGDDFSASDLYAAGTLYTQLERDVRGLTRGIYTGGM